ncbi:nse1 non-SMC component of SMC5-6 complex domain-containing protein [Rhizoctonia solani AG-1 IA]|uniref:Non-structural maintenance of chromosomes element 1 homolog n=1 Tax=Thanatephorus cucumeris (strain AG1-IA) TaxID=983506 RepID=L8X833_THACA|nr:nse1 non-SMC component of SMC5-6 complex domain-containing protein [Rhizoctonia solani AG-1 IA]
MLQRRWASETTVKVLFLKCMEATQGKQASSKLGLEKFDLRFSSTRDECTGETLWINTKQDAATMLATEYNATEIQYFKLVVEQIMLADNEVFSIPATAALREVSQLQGKGGFVSSIKPDLNEIPGGDGIHLLLGPYLSYKHTSVTPTQMNTPNALRAWWEPVTKGIACHTNNCGARLHIHCYAVVVRAARDRGVQCPTCGSSWEDESVRKIGEEAVKGNQTHQRAARGNEEEPEEEDLEEEMEDAMQGAESEDDMNVDESTQNSSVKNKKGKG